MKNREYLKMCEVLPQKENEKFRIVHKTGIKPSALEIMRDAINNGGFQMLSHIREDKTYTILQEKGVGVWMSDTPMETYTNREFLLSVNGKVLIFGLGMGLIIAPLLNDDLVDSILVVEKDIMVIDLVSEHLKSLDVKNKLTIVEGDADTYEIPKTEKFDTIYFDIWMEICGDNYEHTKTLHKRYRPNFNYDNPNRFMDSWVRERVKRLHNENKNSYYGW